MKATLLYGAGDIRVEDVPDPRIENPTDVVVRVTHGCICGSDLWPYQSAEATARGRSMGHELIGIVEDAGAEVTRIRRGDQVIAPFWIGDGTCEFCREGMTTACRHGGVVGTITEGGQGEAVRIPFADACLLRVPVAPDPALMASLLTLSDVFGTGHHAAVCAQAGPGRDVVVVGDGAVGLLAVLAARRLGAERIVLMGRHPARTDLGRDFGATDVVAARGEEGEQQVRDLLGGDGAHSVVEAVGLEQSLQTAIAVARPGGAVGVIGVPQNGTMPNLTRKFLSNITIAGGPAPTQTTMRELLPDILDGQVEPGRVFDRTVGLDGVPDGYRAMNDREALKVLVRP